MVTAETIELIEDTHFVAGVFLNCLLLYSIRRFTRKALGSYKQLLTIFAAFDIFLLILHASVKPKITSFYASAFTVPFALMNIHFLYRFWSIRYPHLIAYFSEPKFIAAISLVPVAEFISWFVLCYCGITGEGPSPGKSIVSAEFENRYGHEMLEGWLMMDHWVDGEFQLRIFVSMIGFDVIMVGSFTIASTLGGFTYYYIRKADTVSHQALNIQLMLFISVCAQTLVPLVFVYIPYFCVINFPFLLLPILSFDDACMTLTSCFPAYDAILIMVLMKDYREGLSGMCKRKKKLPPGTTFIMSSAIWPSAPTISIMPSVVSTAR